MSPRDFIEQISVQTADQRPTGGYIASRSRRPGAQEECLDFWSMGVAHTPGWSFKQRVSRRTRRPQRRQRALCLQSGKRVMGSMSIYLDRLEKSQQYHFPDPLREVRVTITGGVPFKASMFMKKRETSTRYDTGLEINIYGLARHQRTGQGYKVSGCTRVVATPFGRNRTGRTCFKTDPTNRNHCSIRQHCRAVRRRKDSEIRASARTRALVVMSITRNRSLDTGRPVLFVKVRRRCNVPSGAFASS